PGRTVDVQETRERVLLRRAEVRGAAPIGRLDVGERAARHPPSERRERGAGIDRLRQRRRGPRAAVAARCGDRLWEIAPEEKLPRRETPEFLARRLPAVHLGHAERAGREVDRRQREALALPPECNQEARRTRLEALLLEDRPGRDDPHDLPFHEP